MESTKLRILDEALTLFSQFGYDTVSVAQIADAVGIKAPSLYKHYRSKEDIFQAVIQEMDEQYALHSASLHIDGSNPEQDEERYRMMDASMLVELGKAQFLYFLKDPYQSRFRKLLTIEQYHSPTLAKHYRKQYFDDAIEYQSQVFAALGRAGQLRKEDARVMALHFFAPIYMLLQLCDTQPDREMQALDDLENHIRLFVKLYRVE